MAESVVKLKVENTEYDAKIRRAAAGLSRLEDECRKTGTSLNLLGERELKFVRQLGQMETVTKSARGRIGELTTAFTDLSVRFNKLTEEEKNSDYGRALSKSLSEIRDRIVAAKGELNEINGQINNNGSLLDQLSGKLGVNIGQFGGLAGALAGATAAAKVAQDAFFSNEQNLDEWGRVVESSKSVYNGFLDALNTGDISGFLQRIGQIVSAARDAYNALDELATYNAFNQMNVSKARAGLSNSINDFKEGNGSTASVKAAGDELKKQLQVRQKKEQEAYEKKVREIATQRGVSGDALLKALSGSYGSYEKLKNTKMTGKRTQFTGGGMFGGSQAITVAVPANEIEKMGDALRRINDTELNSLQSLGAQAFETSQEIAQIDKQVFRATNSKSGGGGKGGKGGKKTEIIPAGSIADAQKKLQDLQKAWTNATTPDERESLAGQIKKAEAELQMMKKPIEFKIKFIPEDELTKGLANETPTLPTNSLANVINATGMSSIDSEVGSEASWYLEECRKKAEELSNAGEDVKMSWQAAANAIGGIGSVLQQLPSPAAKVFGIIAEAIANVAGGFAAALASSKTGKLSVWEWIAEAAAGTATMVATIASIRSATAGSYATGGIVGGNSYSGDNLRIGVNSGEVVLNQAQTANLATKLNSNAEQRMNAQPYVDCETIFLGINNMLRRSGRGELITTR